MKNVGHKFSSAAALLLIVTSAGFAGHYDRTDSQRQAQKADKATVWHARANQCSQTEDPPPGANCTQ